MPTNLPTAVDEPFALTSETTYSGARLQDIYAKIEALAAEVVRGRNANYTCVFPKADPNLAALAKGIAVCLATSSGEPTMKIADDSSIAAGAVVLGVLTEATAPGQRGRVATTGAIDRTITGLLPGFAGQFVRIHGATGALFVTPSVIATDRIIGRVADDGSMALLVEASTYTGPAGNGAPSDGADNGKRYRRLNATVQDEAEYIRINGVWVPQNGGISSGVDVSAGNHTLTPAQYANKIILIGGGGNAPGHDVVFPAGPVALWFVRNQSEASVDLMVSGSGSVYALADGDIGVYLSTGTDMVGGRLT